MRMRDLRREFWLHLYAQGFPKSINDENLRLARLEVEAQAYKGKRLRLKGYSFASGGLHSDDVALIMLLAEELGLKQGLDWDWGLEFDNYHFEVAYRNSDGVKKLLKLIDLYNEESIILMNVGFRLLSQKDTLEDFEIERLFSEERMKFREWQRILEEETLRTLKEFLNKLGDDRR